MITDNEKAMFENLLGGAARLELSLMEARLKNGSRVLVILHSDKDGSTHPIGILESPRTLETTIQPPGKRDAKGNVTLAYDDLREAGQLYSAVDVTMDYAARNNFSLVSKDDNSRQITSDELLKLSPKQRSARLKGLAFKK